MWFFHILYFQRTAKTSKILLKLVARLGNGGGGGSENNKCGPKWWAVSDLRGLIGLSA